MSQKKKGLGRGLNSLIPNSSVGSGTRNNQVLSNSSDASQKVAKVTSDVNIEKTIFNIDVDEIKAKANQPRKDFNDEKIEELSKSIKAHGVIQPLLVRKDKIGYEIIAGERRWRAARKAGLTKVPCIIKELTNQENMLLTIIENMQRENLNPIEEAEGLEQMVSLYGMTQDEVAKQVGKSRSYVTNSLRLLKLPEEIRNLVATDVISNGHGRCLITIKDKMLQLEIVKEIVNKNLSVRETEKLVAAFNPEKLPEEKKKQKNKEKDEAIKALENTLKNLYNTDVNIRKKGKKGIIEISFENDNELERILAILNS